MDRGRNQAAVPSRDESYMERALELAEKGRGRTSPNPMVGCVVVREGRVVGEGYHAAAGEPHAEVVALHAAGPRATRATIYVTLEPCCTHGRTLPCTDALIEAQVARVVAATDDPNPRVCGKGFAALRDAGIDVVSGVLEQRANRQNEAYRKWISTGRPFVTAKWAMSLDGKIAVRRGVRTRLTSQEAWARVHELRAATDAVIIGVGTVLADNPQLTVRGPVTQGIKTPLRVIVDSKARTPLDGEIVRTAHGVPTLVAVTGGVEEARLHGLRSAGVGVVVVPGDGGRVDISALLAELGGRDVVSVLLEGGAALAGSFAAIGEIDKIVAFVAPRLLVSAGAPSATEARAEDESISELRVRDVEVELVGPDVMITGYPVAEEGEQQCLPV